MVPKKAPGTSMGVKVKDVAWATWCPPSSKPTVITPTRRRERHIATPLRIDEFSSYTDFVRWPSRRKAPGRAALAHPCRLGRLFPPVPSERAAKRLLADCSLLQA